jgi:hypothetical protein
MKTEFAGQTPADFGIAPETHQIRLLIRAGAAALLADQAVADWRTTGPPSEA